TFLDIFITPSVANWTIRRAQSGDEFCVLFQIQNKTIFSSTKARCVTLRCSVLSMLYFAYGSNMCTARLRGRDSSATPVRIGKLLNHSLRFHKRSTDGSAKCDAYYFTGKPQDVIWGVIFEID